MSRMDVFPAAFSSGWMMPRALYHYCYGSGFSRCTSLLVCVFGGLGLSEVYHSPPFVLISHCHLLLSTAPM